MVMLRDRRVGEFLGILGKKLRFGSYV